MSVLCFVAGGEFVGLLRLRFGFFLHQIRPLNIIASTRKNQKSDASQLFLSCVALVLLVFLFVIHSFSLCRKILRKVSLRVAGLTRMNDSCGVLEANFWLSLPAKSSIESFLSGLKGARKLCKTVEVSQKELYDASLSGNGEEEKYV